MRINYLAVSLPLRLAVGVFATVLASALFAQNEMPLPSPSKDGTVRHGDSSFLKKAAKAGAEEINISTVAVSRATNPQVKELAQLIVTDHQGIAAQLTNLASAKGVELPMKEPSESKWAKKSAKNFDKAYLKEMVDQHEDAIELFAKAAKSDDPQIATFATQSMTTLQSHLTKAKELLKQLP